MANLYVYLLPAILHAVYACVPLTPPRPRPTPKPPGATGEVPATTTTTETTTTTVEACSGTPDNSTVTEDGNRCVFPFKDGDILHMGCVDYKGKYDWCATSLKSDCSFDTWSKCLETTSKPEEKCLTEEVNSGKECLFPFMFEGKEHLECLPYKGKYWCGLTYEYDKQRWGYCTQALCPPTKVEATEVPVTTQGPTEVPVTSQEPETTTTTTTEVTTPLDWEDAQTTVDIAVDGSFYSCNIDFKMTTDQGVKYKDVTSSCSGSSKTDDMIDKLGVHRFTLTMQSGIGLSCEVGAALLPQSLTLSVEVMESTLKCEPLDSQCITIGGNNFPDNCVFPYNYQGRHYKACTDSSKDPSKLWCPTVVTASGEAEKDSWGFCATSCTYCGGSPITRGAPDCGFDCLLNPAIKMVGYEQAELLKPTMSMTIELPEQDNVGGNYKFKIGSQTIQISCPETKFHHPDLKGENTVIASCGPEKYRFTVKTQGGAILGTEIKKDFFGCDPCPQSTTYVKGYSLYLKVKSIGNFPNIASVSECHSLCLENSLCNSFEFSKTDKKCKLIQDVVKTGFSTEISDDYIICTKSGPTGEACSITNMKQGRSCTGVSCISNSDCKPVATSECKEKDNGGAKTCQTTKTNTCQNCKPEQFCNAAKRCQNVICAVTSDCSTVTGHSLCKQVSSNGIPTCKKNAPCDGKTCYNGEYCTYDDKCLEAVYCRSNTDCKQPSECKQTVAGGAKTCKAKTCTACSSEQFCDAQQNCQDVYCISNTDCPHSDQCKETVAGGAKTCTLHCIPKCSPGQFCDAANICQDRCITADLNNPQSSTLCGEGRICDYKSDRCKKFFKTAKGTCLNDNRVGGVLNRPALLVSSNVAIFKLAMKTGVHSDWDKRCNLDIKLDTAGLPQELDKTPEGTKLARASLEILDAIYWLSDIQNKQCTNMMRFTISIALMKKKPTNNNPTYDGIYLAGNLNFDEISKEWKTFMLEKPGVQLAIVYVLKKWSFSTNNIFALKIKSGGKGGQNYMKRHAEMQLVRYADENQMDIIALGVSKPPCCLCDAILTGGTKYGLSKTPEVFSGPGTGYCRATAIKAPWCGQQFGSHKKGGQSWQNPDSWTTPLSPNWSNNQYEIKKI